MSADLVDKCESESIKTHAAQLLRAIENNVDGMAAFIVDFCCNFIVKTMEQTAENEQFIMDVIQKFELKIQNKEEIIEVSLMILTLMKDTIGERIDLQVKLDREML